MFISYSNPIKKLLTEIVASPKTHAKWLNTLSFLENCGARKIAACEHPTLVKEEMLKHAAEEFRHALHLKRQIKKVTSNKIETYSLKFMLGGTPTLHYLKALDLKTCRYLKSLNFGRDAIKQIAYLLVTYAIELRADELYKIYDEVLQKAGSQVSVKSILLEEKEHLHEMKEAIKLLPEGFTHAEQIVATESHLCKNWLEASLRDISI